MPTELNKSRIYDGDGDRLMEESEPHAIDRIILLPDALPSKTPDPTPRQRIMWGQHMLEDLLAGRYRSLVCAVNAHDNSHGIIAQLATLLGTSQWDEPSITAVAKQFSSNDSDTIKVMKYDMDMVEVLALLRPANRDHMTLTDLSVGFKIVSEMIRVRTSRLPSASVSFLGARSNALLDSDGNAPSFETVLRIMHQSGYTGDIYPAPAMWAAAPTAVYARYPFPPSVESMRHGGS
jgi:hypothetical protein